MTVDGKRAGAFFLATWSALIGKERVSVYLFHNVDPKFGPRGQIEWAFLTSTPYALILTAVLVWMLVIVRRAFKWRSGNSSWRIFAAAGLLVPFEFDGIVRVLEYLEAGVLVGWLTLFFFPAMVTAMLVFLSAKKSS
ncbi:MAG: hypothetical protein HY737_01935 [Candidatus Omnitrophica bacterium]|nr:hypothetical protein [Candidatus Omnitrophota bacterium]